MNPRNKYVGEKRMLGKRELGAAKEKDLWPISDLLKITGSLDLAIFDFN